MDLVKEQAAKAEARIHMAECLRKEICERYYELSKHEDPADMGVATFSMVMGLLDSWKASAEMVKKAWEECGDQLLKEMEALHNENSGSL